MTMRALLLTPDDPRAPRSGIGVIVRETARALADRGSECEVIVIDDREETSESSAAGPIVRRHVFRQPSDRLMIGRALIGASLNSSEADFVAHAADESRRSDFAMWFGSTWDPITRVLAGALFCPVVHHPNDSITLFERQRARTMVRGTRLALAARHERRMLRQPYRGVVYVSAHDAALAAQLEPRANVFTVPLGVDLEHFRPAARAEVRGRQEILFAGVMAYRPNVDAARYLIERVLPLLPPSVLVRLVGRSPAAEVRELAHGRANVEITGEVPDIAAEYRRASVFAAPIVSGAGFKNKLLEAMASGLPIVTTSLAIESFGVVPPGALVADDPASFADALSNVLADDELRVSLGSAARQFVEHGWSWSTRTTRLLEALGHA